MVVKYWNKDKEIRQRCWTKISQPKNILGTSDQGLLYYISDLELKRWCQQQPSTGKFYYYYGSTTWWFELPEDATWFVLRWS